MSNRSWAALLDMFEEQLRRQEAVLRDGVEPPGDLALPLLEQPIPAGLVPRAMSLLDRCRHLEERAAGQVNRRRPPVRAYGGRGRTLGSI
jgi:hypothetical protein